MNDSSMATGKHTPLRDVILRSFALNMEYALRLLGEVDDAFIANTPQTGINHAAWIIGHLAYSFEMIGGELGLAPWSRAAPWPADVGQSQGYRRRCPLIAGRGAPLLAGLVTPQLRLRFRRCGVDRWGGLYAAKLGRRVRIRVVC